MSANKLIFETGIDGTGFHQGMHALGHEATHNLKSLVVGAFGLYGIHQIFDRTIEKAEELINTSKRLGEVPEQLQVMRQAAKEGGVEFSKLAMAYDKLNIAREKALGGDKGKMAAFARFGITADDLKTQTAGELLRGKFHLAAMSKNPQSLDAPGAEIFGAKGFGSLIPVLKTDFGELGDSMRGLGTIMSTETAVGLKMLTEKFGLLASIVEGILGPAIIRTVDGILDGLELYLRWIDQKMGINPEPDNPEPDNGPGFLKKTGHGAAGVAIGLLALGDLLGESIGVDTSGPQSQDGESGSQTRIRQANEQFAKSFGFMSGGTLDGIAEDLSKNGGGIADKMKAARDKMKEEMQKLIESLKHPPAPDDVPEKGDKNKFHEYGKRSPDFSPDALLQVGNFLGGGSAMVNSIAQQHLDVAKNQLDVMNKLADKTDMNFDKLVDKVERGFDKLSDKISDDYDVP